MPEAFSARISLLCDSLANDSKEAINIVNGRRNVISSGNRSTA